MFKANRVSRLFLGLMLVAPSSWALETGMHAPDLTMTCRRLLSRSLDGKQLVTTKTPHRAQLDLGVLNERIRQTRAELILPEARRKTKDPRSWIGRFFGTNPVTTELQTKLNQENKDRKILEKLQSVVSTFIDHKLLDPKGSNLPHVLDFLRQEAVQLATEGQVFASTADPESAKTIRSEIKSAVKKLGRLEILLKNKKYSELTFEVEQMAIALHVTAIREPIQAQLGYAPSDSILKGLLNLALRHEKNIQEVADLFCEIEIAGRSRPNEENGIEDFYVLILTQTSLAYGLDAKTVYQKFIAIDQLGANTKPDFNIDDREVVVLVEGSIHAQTSPEVYMSRFFAIEAAGEVEGQVVTSDSFYLNDPALAILTRTSFQYAQGLSDAQATKKVLDLFFQIYSLGQKHESEDWSHLNDLSSAMLTDFAFQTHRSAEQMSELFFRLLQNLKTHGLSDLSDEDLVRILIYQLKQGLSVEAMGAFIAAADQYDGVSGRLHLPRALTVLSYAIAHAKMKKMEAQKLSDLDFAEASKVSLLILSGAEDTLVDEESREERMESFSSSIANNSSSSDNFGVHFGVDSDGFKPTLGMGSGLGIDLTDGSLKINLGSGISFDTDGDGIGFNLF